MVELEKPRFDAAAFLANAGLGRSIMKLTAKDAFFLQGDPANSVFYLQKGRAKVTVVSPAGKEATIMLLSAGDFVGEVCLRGGDGRHQIPFSCRFIFNSFFAPAKSLRSFEIASDKTKVSIPPLPLLNPATVVHPQR
jgi:CRP-like cAMP-binding protein